MTKSKWFLLVSLVFLAANFVWLLFFVPSYNNNFDYDNYHSFRARLIQLDKKLNGWQLVLEPENLAGFSGKVLVYAPLYPEYQYGNILEISCRLSQPTPIIDDSGQVFAYDKYLAKDNILATCYRPRVKVIGQAKDFSFYLFKAKSYFWQNLNNYLVEPASSMAKAMLLATRREIPGQTRDIFARVGLSHIMAISGLHIAIIVWLLQSLLSSLGLSRKVSFLSLIFILLIYLYLIGFPSSAVRASCMVMVALLGPFLGRSTLSFYSLLLVADIFILINPYLLLYDIGFQLSFLAVLGLLSYVRYFNKVLVFIPEKFKLREVLSVTLAAQVFTWPLIVYHFNILSLIAPLANFLILPLLPFILILSLVLAIVGFWPILAKIIAWPLFLLLKFITAIAERLAQIPYAYLEITSFSLFYLILGLSFMFVITWVLKPYNYE